MNDSAQAKDESSEFAIARRRDAWGVIRGFVYQVDHTIKRWLELGADQVLELERGEDIDLINCSISASSPVTDRTLEQIKHRTTPISLRTSSVLAALANAFEHRTANPSLKLAFQYTTNATITSERLSLIHSTRPALTMWQEIHAGALPDATEAGFITHIRGILVSAERPEDVPAATWSAFKNFIDHGGNGELLVFVRSYAWSTGAGNAEAIAAEIHQILISKGHARDRDIAVRQYERLFLYVFKTLSASGIKRLTRSSLEEQLALPNLTNADSILLSTLTSHIGKLEDRVDVLESELADTTAVVNDIQNALSAGGYIHESTSSVIFSITHPITDPPPPVERIFERTENVAKLLALLKNSTWLAINGGAGMGKTQLGILLIRHLGECLMWLRFRELQPAQSHSRLLAALHQIAVSNDVASNISWQHVLSKFKGRKISLVLDDLPRLDGSEEFTESLITLALACKSMGVQIISTSHWELPSRLITSVPTNLISATACPFLSDDEAKGILKLHNAPQKTLNAKFVGFLNGLAGRHPTLLAANARFLEQRRWNVDNNTLAVLIQGKHTDVSNDTIERLLRTVEESDTRDLLFRLKLVWGSFSIDDVNILATIPPAVSRAGERLHKLTGLWVQRDVNNTYSISPLVKAVGDRFLDNQLKMECHDTLGRRFFHRRTVDPNDVWESVGHFINAEQFGRAASVLVVAFRALKRLRSLPDHRGLLDVWKEQPLPAGMELPMKLYLRAVQLDTRAHFSLPIDFLLDDLDRLFEQASTKDGWAALAAAVTVNMAICKEHPKRANRYVLTALKLCPDLVGPDGKKLVFHKGLGPEYLLWTTIAGLEDISDLQDWISGVSQLSLSQQRNLFASRYADDACIELVEKLLKLELKKPAHQQNWDDVLAALAGIEAWALRIGSDLLEATAVGGKILVIAEHKTDLTSALALGESYVARPTLKPNQRFVIKDALGRALRFADRNDLAVPWLDGALREQTEEFSLEKISTALHASFATGDTNPGKAVEYAEKSVLYARNTEKAVIMLTTSLAELAIAKWLAGDTLDRVFDVWVEAIEHLLSIKRDTEIWKGLYMVFGHVSGFFASLAHTGKPPEMTPDGEPFAAPVRGMLFSFKLEAAKLYDANNAILLPAQIALFAQGCKKDEEAVAWALKSIDLSRKQKQHQILPVFGLILIPDLLLNNQYTDAIYLAKEVASIVHASYLFEKTNAGKFLPIAPDKLNIEAILGPIDSGHWQQVEIDSIVTGLLPATIRICTVALKSEPEAAEFANEVKKTCDKIASSSSNPSLWRNASTLFENAFVQKSPAKQLMSDAKSFNNDVLLVISYFGSSLRDDVSLQAVCRMHLMAFPFVEQVFRTKWSIFRQIAIPFISDFWRIHFAKARFQFTTPQIVEQELKTAMESTDERVPRRILRIVSNALGVSLSEFDREWLSS